MVGNFSFVIKGRLAGAARPGWWGKLEDDLDELKRHGITALVTLTEEPLNLDAIRGSGLAYLHLPIEDFTAPSIEQIEEFLDFVERQLDTPEAAVAVHCLAGRGRTGTMLACYLVATGLESETAIRTVRRLRPGSIETSDQEDIVHSFSEHWLEQKRARAERQKKAAKKKTTEKPGMERGREKRGGTKKAKQTSGKKTDARKEAKPNSPVISRPSSPDNPWEDMP
jgi:atypical dual specificity phosphatase